MDAELADRLYRGERRQSRSISSSWRARRQLAAGRGECVLTRSSADLGCPRLCCARLTRGDRRCLSEPTRTLLQGAAVAGDPFEPELAAAAAAVGRGERRSRRSTSCWSSSWSAQPGVPRRFRFRHPLVRRAVYEARPGGWVLGAHERCAAALAERGRRGDRARPPRRAGRPPRRHGRDRAPARGSAGSGGAGARRAPRAGSPPPLRLLPETRLPSSGSGSCSPALRRSRRPAGSRRAAKPCSRASPSSPRMRSRCASG